MSASHRTARLTTRGAAAYGLTILTLINGVNYLDRYISSGVLDQLQATFHASGAQVGLVMTVFILVYMVAAPVGGRLGDVISRRWLIGISVFIWSLATFASGLAGSLMALLIARALTGFGEAGYATVAPALISDLYPREVRTPKLSIFYVALPIGSALGFAIGGWVGERYSWHHAFFVGGTLGIVLALLSAFLPEPARGATEGITLPQKVPFLEGLKALLPNGIFWTSTAGLTLMTFSIGGLAVWMPTFLKLERGMSAGNVGIAFGAVTCGAGLLGTLAGGALGARAERKSPTGGLWVSGVGLVMAAPAMLVAAEAHSRAVIFAAIFTAQFFIFLNTGPLNAAICNAVAPNFRAFAMGLNVLCFHLLGDAISPPVIGFIKDRTSLETAIVLNAVPVFLGGMVLLVGARLFRGALAEPSPALPRPG